MKNYIIYLGVLVLLTTIESCVEPFDIKSETFESALVIEGTITNELTNQEIHLSRTFKLDTVGPNPESGANVKVTDLAGNSYSFQEKAPGVYKSIQQFSANNHTSYQLEVTTRDGRKYSSEPTELTSGSRIDELKAVKSVQTIDGTQKEGIAVVVTPGQGNSNFYRYTYQETYEIRSLYDIPIKLIAVNGMLQVVRKEEQDHICYTTKNSERIIVSGSSGLTNNTATPFPVTFFSKDNPAISYRYSSLVKQYSLSRQAYNFYEVLNELSGSDNLFSQNQPGFINNNVFSLTNDQEKVLGYFNVSAVDSQRIFFSFTDFYDSAERPLPPFNCIISRPGYETVLHAVENEDEGLGIGLIGPASDSSPPGEGDGPYRVTARPCVDCTVLGTIVKPDFWED